MNRDRLPLLAIACAAFVFFSPVFLQGKVFLAADNLYHYHPWKSFAPYGFLSRNPLITDPVNMGYSFYETFNRELRQGRFAAWNPYILTGVPLHNGRSHPLTLLLHRLLPTAAAISLQAFAYLALMGLAMYLYLKQVGAGRAGALFGAVAYMFNGCAMVWLSFETVVQSGAYVPLLLLAMERFSGPRRWGYALLAALVLGLAVLSGHVQYTLYIGVLLLLYTGFLLVRAGVRGAPPTELAAIAACSLAAAAGGALIGAAELLPTREAIDASSRVLRTFGFRELFDTLGRVPLRWLVTLIFPDYFGSPVMRFQLFPSPPKEYLNYNELCLYLGVPTLFAFLALAVRPRTAHARFFLVLTVLVLAMLSGSFLFYPFYAWFPGLDRLNPMRMIFIFVFAASAAAGLGVGSIEGAGARSRRIFLGAAAALTAGIVALALASAGDGLTSFFNGEQLVGPPPAPPGVESRLRGFRAFTSPVILKPLLAALLSGAIFSLWAVFRERRWSRLLPLLATVLLAGDLMSFGWGYNPPVAATYLYPTTPSIEFLKKQPGPFRVVLDTERGFFVNVFQPYGIQEVGGYMTVYPARVNRLLSHIEYGTFSPEVVNFGRLVMFSNVVHPLFDLLNVRYLVTAPGIRLPENPRYRLVHAGDLTVYENLQALPRAFAVHRHVVLRDVGQIIGRLGAGEFSPRDEVILEEEQPAAFVENARAAAAASPVEVRSYTTDAVEVAAQMSADGWVVLSDAFYPGWEVEVDGRPSRILRADCALRAVAVPAGSHTVVFRYRSAALRAGRVISLSALLLAMIGVVYCFRVRRSE